MRFGPSFCQSAGPKNKRRGKTPRRVRAVLSRRLQSSQDERPVGSAASAGGAWPQIRLWGLRHARAGTERRSHTLGKREDAAWRVDETRLHHFGWQIFRPRRMLVCAERHLRQLGGNHSPLTFRQVPTLEAVAGDEQSAANLTYDRGECARFARVRTPCPRHATLRVSPRSTTRFRCRTGWRHVDCGRASLPARCCMSNLSRPSSIRDRPVLSTTLLPSYRGCTARCRGGG